MANEIAINDELIVEKLDDGNFVFSMLEGMDEVVVSQEQMGRFLSWLNVGHKKPGLVAVEKSGFFTHLENG